MIVDEKQLKRFALDSGLVSRTSLSLAESAAENKGVPFRDALVSHGNVSVDDVRRMEAHVLGVPFVTFQGGDISFDVLSLIPEPIARVHNIVAVKKSDRTLEVALLDIKDLSAVDFLRKSLGLKIVPHLTDHASLKSALVHYQKKLKSEFGTVIKAESEKLSQEVSVIRVVDALFRHALVQNASDIHIDPQEKELLIRYRIDGVLRDAMSLPIDAATPIIAHLRKLAAIMPGTRAPHMGRFKADMNGESVSFQVSFVPTLHGEKTLVRLARKGIQGSTLESLGFRDGSVEHVHQALRRGAGMIVVAGLESTDISSTLYGLLDILNAPHLNIATVETAPGATMPRINQTRVRTDIGFDSGAALRAVLKQDSDVVMVSDVADSETATLAINAALAGKLILVGLKAKSAGAAISRLADLGIDAAHLSSVSLVIAERRVGKLADRKDMKILTKTQLAALGKVVNLDRMLELFRIEKIIGAKDGWTKVLFGPANYKGHTTIREVLVVSPTIKNLIQKGASAAEIEARAKKDGMLTMLEDGILAAAQGVTTIEEVLKAVAA